MHDYYFLILSNSHSTNDTLSGAQVYDHIYIYIYIFCFIQISLFNYLNYFRLILIYTFSIKS